MKTMRKLLIKYVFIFIMAIVVVKVMSFCSNRVIMSDGDWDYYELNNSDDIQMMNSEIDMDDVYHD